MLKKYSFTMALLLFGKLCFGVNLDVNVQAKFRTTTNVTTLVGPTESVGAVVMAFEMDRQLYEQIDAFPDTISGFPVSISGINVEAIKISATELIGSENITASIRMAYKNNMLDTALPLFSATGKSVSALKNGITLDNQPGLSSFNTIMLNDITNANNPRLLDKLLFVIKIKLDGPDAATIDLATLELQVELKVHLHYIMNM